MSLTENIRQILNGGFQIARRSAQVYSNVTGAYTLFNVTGAVEIVTLGGLVTSAAGGAVTVAMTLMRSPAMPARPRSTGLSVPWSITA